MWKAFLFAGIAAIGNAFFVYGQKKAAVSNNPFIFTAGAVFICTLAFIAAGFLFRGPGDLGYLSKNWSSILISGIGFFITFLGFYLLYSRFGAVYYALYAALSIITTSLGVGVLVYKEPINIYQICALILSILAITLFSYGQSIQP
ncbi:MAG: EamA family transporter [Anaerolineales bacterium]|nr:EamA family transporter [Anaerolineales bacterium]